MHGRQARTIACILGFFLAAVAFSQPSRAGSPLGDGTIVYQVVEPDYYLTFTPPMPEVGKEVAVSLATSDGRPPAGPVRWTLSGTPAANAGVRGASYVFVPSTPGSYNISAEFRDAQGVQVSSMLEIVIGGGFASGGFSQPTAIQEMYLGITPAQPRIGQPATFTFHYGAGIPAGGEVRWDVSGGTIGNLAITGANKETCSFVPGTQNAYFIRAALHDAQGYPLGEVSLGFIPIS